MVGEHDVWLINGHSVYIQCSLNIVMFHSRCIESHRQVECLTSHSVIKKKQSSFNNKSHR